MKKEEFFKQLEYLLQDIPDEEREDALDYYRDYLAEAGSENEEQAIEEFGSPERVAAIIRADIAGNLKDGGSFTERGYEDERFRDPNYQVAKRLDLPDEPDPGAGSGQNGAGQSGGAFQSGGGYQSGAAYQNGGAYQSGGGYQGGGAYQGGSGYQNGGAYQGGSGYRQGPQGRGGQYREPYQEGKGKRLGDNKILKAVLWIVLILVAFPFVLGGGGALLGIIVGIIALIFGIVVAAGAIVFAALAAGVAMIGSGIGFLLSAPFDGIFLFGVGLAAVGCGLLGLVIIYAVAALLLPLIWRGIKKLAGLITGRRPSRHE